MKMKHAVRLFGGAAGLVAVSATVLAVSGMANGYENSISQALPAMPAQHAEARILVAQADAASTEIPVSYSSEQADRGETQYKRDCVECHGEDLRGGLLGGPPLRGQSFEGKYGKGSPAGVLYELMSATMPPDAPGRYSESTYADLMAYILKRNGFPAGGAPLPSDVDALYNMIID